MRKFLGSLVIVSLIAGPAFAADMAVRAPVYTKAPPPVPIYNWTGFYIGGNAGWIGSANNGISNSGTDSGTGGLGAALGIGLIPGSLNLSNNGFIGGGQLGYNWQAGSVVYGLEADIAGISAKGNATVGPVIIGAFAPVTTAYNHEIDWLSTYRARLGVTVAPTVLLYGTGGLAVGQTKLGNTFICPTCAPPASTEASTTNQVSNTSAGWTAGAGVEWMFAPQWSVKAEYLYVDLGSHSSTITYTYGANTSTLTSSVHDTDNVVRGGINYRF
jgi:outer membrane immunogenic protein